MMARFDERLSSLRLDKEVAFMESALRAAGKIALRYFRGAVEIRYKEDRSPVSEADLSVDRYLYESIRSTFPSDGFLCEERPDDGSWREASRCWIVDPIDGTRGFLAGGDDWCLSIALYAGARPLLGALYEPSVNRMTRFSSPGEIVVDGRAFTPRNGNGVARTVALTRKSDVRKLPFGDLGYFWSRSLALKIVALVRGEADFLFVQRPCHLWDIAAAVPILRSAGGLITAPDGGVITDQMTKRISPFHAFANGQIKRDVLSRSPVGPL